MIVRCIDDRGNPMIKLNQIYEIDNNLCDDIFVNVFIDDFWEEGVYASRFEEVTELRVGDIVQIDTKLKKSTLYTYHIGDDMLEFKSEYVTISNIYSSLNVIEHKIKEDNEKFYWTKDMFELFTKRRNIVIKKISSIDDINIFELFNT